jgi:hypothetical protein
MCGATAAPNDGRPHIHTHIEKVTATEPSWLPANFRVIAQGEHVFRCHRCNSFPSLKWPSESGAFAGMQIHLGARHGVGMLGTGAPQQFEMIPFG